MELTESVCICVYLDMFVYVCARVFWCILLKIGASITKMAGCLHRCNATFTCQLLVEVMSHGADSDGSYCLLFAPTCLFLHPLSSVLCPSPAKSYFSSTRIWALHRNASYSWNETRSCKGSFVIAVVKLYCSVTYIYSVTVSKCNQDTSFVVIENMKFVLWKEGERKKCLIRKDQPFMSY